MIRPLDPSSDAEIALVAERMRATLVEVLGQARGEALYTLEWLRDRVRYHLDPDRVAAVFLAEADGEVVGHTILRREEDGAPLGLFSTIFVAPSHRRQGIASALLRHGEEWIRAQGLPRAATNTGQENTPLLHLFEAHGYRAVLRTEEMVRLVRKL